MVSINSTASNSFVLASLRQTNKDITTSQTRIGTGFKINGASDGAAAWATAQIIRTDIKTQETQTGAISIAKARVDAGVAGLDKITDLLTKMKEVSASIADGATTAAFTAAASKITDYQNQITAITNASAFQSKNALTGNSEAVTIGTNAAGAAVQITMTGVDLTANAAALKLSLAAITVVSEDNVQAVAALATAALTEVAGYQTTLSSFSSSLDTQLEFQSTMKSIKESALSGIVDTDMEAESARVTALQVKQQLAYQALAITNSSAQNILRLFQ